MPRGEYDMELRHQNVHLDGMEVWTILIQTGKGRKGTVSIWLRVPDDVDLLHAGRDKVLDMVRRWTSPRQKDRLNRDLGADWLDTAEIGQVRLGAWRWGAKKKGDGMR